MPNKPAEYNFESLKKVVVLSGGTGAAKFLNALNLLENDLEITAIVNTGDDIVHCGLHISPDIDTIIYTLGDEINKKTGWGMKNESWQAMENFVALEKKLLNNLGGQSSNSSNGTNELKNAWFNLGDRDIGTHLYRTSRLRDGASLSQVTKELTKRFSIKVNILPMTDDKVETRITLSSGEEVSFQNYFVKLRHSTPLKSVYFKGAENVKPAPNVMDALESADKIIIAPSNPALSIAPILAIKEIGRLVSKRRRDTVFISPIIGGKALKGPADRVLEELGYIPDAGGVAKFYSDYADTAVIDLKDEHLIDVVEEMGIKCIATNTIMSNKKSSKALANIVLYET